MFFTILLGVFVLAAIVIFAIRPKVTTGHNDVAQYNESGYRTGYVREPIKKGIWWLGFIPLVLAILIALGTCLTTVQAKTVGVPVSFGKPGAPISSGIHTKAPWVKVVKIDTTQQVANFNGGKDQHGTIAVELANKSTADASVSITWKANGDEANNIYGEYRSDDPTDLLYERLVAPNVKQAAQDVLQRFDPMPDKNGNNAPIDYAATAKAIQAAFEGYIKAKGDYIDVVDLKFSRLTMDPDTQKRINDYNAEIQKTKIAEQAEQTAIATAAANKTLADSMAKTEDGATAYCLSLIDQGKLNPPVGFSCFPGGNGNMILQGK